MIFYRDLIKLFPNLHGKVAIWTTEHDVNCKVPNEKRKVREPAAKFSRAELPKYPVIIVTSKFFTDSNGHYAREVTRDNQTTQRALTLVDERPEEVKTYDVTLSEAQVAREALQEAYPETKEA